MEYMYVGKIVNTHGLKGEVRILSDFSDPSCFNVGNKLYISKKDELEIATYRIHKNYHMVTFKGINNIDDVLKYKGENVYIEKDITNHVIEEVISFEVYGTKKLGKVEKLIRNIKYPILVLDSGSMIPCIDEFIENIDYDNKKIYIKEIEGLINEN